MQVGTRQISDDDASSILRQTLCGRRTDGTGTAADERDLALQGILNLAHLMLAALMSGFLANDIAQRSDAFDRRFNDIAGRQKASRPVAGARWGPGKQDVPALEA